MNRIPGLAALVVALTLVSQSASAVKFHDTVAKAQAEAKQGNKYIIVDLFADWCGWCHRMEREVFPSEVFQAAAKNYSLLKLDTEDGKEGTKVATDYGVRSLPTFLVLTPDLALVGIVRGYSPAEQFLEQVQGVEAEYLEYKKRLRTEPKTANDRDKLTLTEEMVERRDLARAEPRLVALTKSSNAGIRDEAYNQLAGLYGLQGKWPNAEATLKQALAVNQRGELAEQNQMALAQVYMSVRNFPAAVTELKRFKTRYPNSKMVPSVNAIIPQLESQIPRK